MDWSFCWREVPLEKFVVLLNMLFDCKFTDRDGNLTQYLPSTFDKDIIHFVKKVATRLTDEYYCKDGYVGSNGSSDFGIHPEQSNLCYFTANSSRKIRYDLQSRTMQFGGVGDKSVRLRKALEIFLGSAGEEGCGFVGDGYMKVPRLEELYQQSGSSSEFVFTRIHYPDQETSRRFFDRLNQLTKTT